MTSKPTGTPSPVPSRLLARARTAVPPPQKTFRLFLNYACNARCPFCFNPPDAPEHEVRGMPLARAIASLAEAHRGGAKSVSFIGGEPTVRPDFLKIVAAARRIGFTGIQLVTNGVRLGEPGYADRAVRAGLNWVDVSIHAHKPELHDRQLGLPGAFERAVRALELLRARGVRAGINCVVNRLNYRILPEFAQAFVDRGVRNFSFFGLRYIGYMGIPGNLELMKVPASETVPYVRRALAVLERAGCLESTYLNEFTPCLLPDYVDRLADWEAGGNPDAMAHPDGTTEASEYVCSEGKVPVAACRDCRYGGSCFGVESSYLALFGESEFLPVREAARIS